MNKGAYPALTVIFNNILTVLEQEPLWLLSRVISLPCKITFVALFHPVTILWLLCGKLTKPLNHSVHLSWLSVATSLFTGSEALAHLVGEVGGGGLHILSDGDHRRVFLPSLNPGRIVD